GGHLFYQMCSDVTGQCINYEEDFTVQLNAQADPAAVEAPGEVLDENVVAEEDLTKKPLAGTDQDVVDAPEKEAEKETVLTQANPLGAEASTEEKEKSSMIAFKILAFLGGLAALLTHCLFPMIPLSAAFFFGCDYIPPQRIRN